ncbi:MAG: hypothetical protein LBU66_06605 [Treponema sp.]|nr:hypothetical protein [Treponema sp.]
MSDDYKTTFNYLLSHIIMPQMIFSNLDFFYETVLPNPDNMRIFMQKAVMHAGAMAQGKPDIEPAYPIENFKMGIYGEVFERSVIVIEMPKYEKDPDNFAVAIPVMRENAGYYTCEIGTDHVNNKRILVIGEWEPSGDSFKHNNYGWIEVNEANNFWLRVVEIAYGSEVVSGENNQSPDSQKKKTDYIDYSHKQYLIVLRNSAEEGDESAISELKKSFEAVRKAAETGDAAAQFNLGIHYDYGFGIDESDENAFKWYEKAANQGNADAMHFLAWAYGHGKGVEKNEQKYYEWEKKAAFAYHEEGRDEEALHCLRDIPSDKEIGALLFKMRIDDQAKGIVSKINPESEKYFKELREQIGNEDNASSDDDDSSSEENAEDEERYQQALDFAAEGWTYYEKGVYNKALDCLERALELVDTNPVYFQCCAEIQKALRNDLAGDYYYFRAKLVDLLIAQKEKEDGNETSQNTEVESIEDLGLKPRRPLVEIPETYDIMMNDEGEVLLAIVTPEGASRLSEFFYSGDDNAVFRRRMDQFFFLENINHEVRERLTKTKKILVAELTAPGKSGKFDDVYEVPVSFLNISGSFDSVDTVRDDGYLKFAAFAALAREKINEGERLRDVFSKDDFPILAAILAVNEDYELLDKYFKEGLPINERTPWWFKDWQPTPLFYITLYRVWPHLKDPVKTLRYLVDHGADPNIASIEGDTPLGNQCFTNGLPEIMKELLDVGADPDLDTMSSGYPIKPLILILGPSEYIEEPREFKPITTDDVERVKMLINAGADVNVKFETGSTPLGMAITYAAGAERNEVVKLLRNRGANVDAALLGMEETAKLNSPESYYALYEFYAGFPNDGIKMPGMTTWIDKKLAKYYLEQSANEGYLPALKVRGEDYGQSI